MSHPDPVIDSPAGLAHYFEAGAKPPGQWGIGLEYERFGVVAASGTPVPYAGPGSVEEMLGRLTGERGWRGQAEAGRLIGASRNGMRLTLEPGGQVELSGAVHRTTGEVRRELQTFLAEIEAVSRPAGVRWLGVGMQPLAPIDAIPWIPKERYAIMRDYLPRRGTRGLVMMKQTACIQANLDYSSEADAMEKLRTAMGITPLVTAAFAHSPLTEGRPNGFLSARAWAWRDTDPDRCGLLRLAFRDAAGFDDYLEYALDVPMFFVVWGDGYRPAGGMTFRRFIERGFEGRRPTLTDFELHLTTLFPEVRLKRYLEMRGADSGDPATALALAAFWMGVLYDRDARRGAWDLVKHWTFEERDALLDSVCRLGPEAPLPRRAAGRGAPQRVKDLLGDLVALARAGCASRGDEEGVLRIDQLRASIEDAGACPAARLLDVWSRGPDPGRLIADLSRNTLLEDV